MSRSFRSIVFPLLSLAASACGGGEGGGGIASTPTPVASGGTPTPAATQVTILPSPATQQFATFTQGGADSQLSIRYDAASSIYEVSTPSSGWQGLRDHPDYHATPNVYFAFGPADRDAMNFFFASANNYQYATVAIWGKGVGAYWDDATYTAFGTATSAGGMPVTGSASYAGTLVGASSYRENDYLIGGTVPSTIGGDIILAFDFGAGTLSGAIHPTLSSYAYEGALPTLAFKNTVFGVGSTSFSGTFDTTLSGSNNFSGAFAGPNAQEAMGKFAFPFLLPGTTDRFDAFGAFVAKR